MIVLDTNVLSDFSKARPSLAVGQWIDAQDENELWITTTTLSELEHGVRSLPIGRRQTELDKLHTMLTFSYRDRIIPFDADQAIVFGGLIAERRRSGFTIDRADAQIAAACVSREASLATRNTKDFEGIPGLELINPWEAEN